MRSAKAAYLSGIAVLLTTLAACGLSPQPGTKPVQTTGAIGITIDGLPAASAAAVRVAGPLGLASATSKDISSSTVIADLAPGTYEVLSKSVQSGRTIYYTRALVRSVEVEAGEVTSVAIEYLPQGADQGGAKFTVLGLPAGLRATLRLSGPGGYQSSAVLTDPLTEQLLVNGLPAGEYSVAAERVAALHGYEPQVSSQAFTVPAGGEVDVTLRYQVVSGAIEFVIEGLPQGLGAGITLSGPSGAAVTIDAAAVISDLAPGLYDYDAPRLTTAADVTTGAVGYAYEAVSRSIFNAELKAGETKVVTLGYEPVTGSIVLVVRGLPTGATADVSFSRDGQELQEFSSTGAVNNLLPDSYDYLVGDVVHDFTFAGDPSNGVAMLAAGETTVVEVAYRASEGDLELLSAGLPTGVSPLIRVGADGEVHVPPKTLRLPAQRYALLAPDELTVGGTEYHLIRGPAFVDVVPGREVSATFEYAVVGALDVQIEGLAEGQDADVVVTGPRGYDSGRLTRSETLRLLPVGQYTVSASGIPPLLYPDEPSQSVSVTADATATVTVRYRPPVTYPGTARGADQGTYPSADPSDQPVTREADER